ncbi:MAG TPA: helix-turn-helix domain-containing protein [Acidisarcina sp.]
MNMSAQEIIDFDKSGVKSPKREHTGTEFKIGRKKPPQRVSVAPENKILVSREEASQMLSISQRALDYLVATKRLTARRIGGRVLIPVSDLRQYARFDHPERIAG